MWPRSAVRAFAAVLLLAGAAAAAAPAAAAIRGASPEVLDRYIPVKGQFQCFDQSRSIDAAKVNDNFCDCPDGSDEPGTSACANGLFYCRNRGHEPQYLSSSFIDDGICDCCDGTDELSGCTNTCIEKNSAKRDELRAKIDAYKASLEVKASYASSAVGVRQHIKQRHKNVDGDIKATEAELTKLTADKTRIEEETEVKRADHKKKQEELAAQRRAEAEAAAAAKAAADAEAAAADAAAADSADAAEPSGAQDQQAAVPDEETAEERGRRIAAQWTNDPAAAGPKDAGAPASANAAAGEPAEVKDASSQPANGSPWSLGSALEKAKATMQGLIKRPAAASPEPDVDTSDSPNEWDGDEFPLEHDEEREHFAEDEHYAPPSSHDIDYEPFDDSELRRVRDDHSAAESKLAELRTEKERVARQVGFTFNDAWAGLMNKCLEARMPQFTYKFCFFDKATQIDNNGGHETSLGLWSGFAKGGTEAVFEGGDYCHQAPARSLRVKLECGAEEHAWDASEPETCAYIVHAATPAACKAESLKELESAMAALQAEEAALAAEIAAEEKQRQLDLQQLRARMAATTGGADGTARHDEL